MAADSAAKCYLLSLPAELRNTIYEMAFSEDVDGPVDLATASPPSHALLLTCRQVYQEAKSIYDDASERFWHETSFELCLTTPADYEGIFQSLARHSNHLTQVKRLSVPFPIPSFTVTWTLMPEGHWRCERTKDGTEEFVLRYTVFICSDDSTVKAYGGASYHSIRNETLAGQQASLFTQLEILAGRRDTVKWIVLA